MHLSLDFRFLSCYTFGDVDSDADGNWLSMVVIVFMVMVIVILMNVLATLLMDGEKNQKGMLNAVALSILPGELSENAPVEWIDFGVVEDAAVEGKVSPTMSVDATTKHLLDHPILTEIAPNNFSFFVYLPWLVRLLSLISVNRIF